MKTKFCFVVHQGEISPTDKVYMVWIGTAKRDQVKRTLVECYAEDTQAFFRVWDEDTDFYLQQQRKRFVSGRLQVHPNFNVISCTISQLYKAIVDGTLDMMKCPDHVVQNSFRMMSLFDPSSLPSFPKKNSLHSATSASRKNLKPSEQMQLQHAMIGFGLILAFFLLSAFLEGLEKALLY